jgi:hypothetical protein
MEHASMEAAMIVATYIEDVPYLLNCFKLWQHSFRAKGELWVCGPPHVRTMVDLLPQTTWFDAYRIQPYDYVGGHCAAAALLPFPNSAIVMLTDPDVVLVDDINPQPFGDVVMARGLGPFTKIPSNPFSCEQIEKRGPTDWATYEKRWEELMGYVPTYINTGVVISKGKNVKCFAPRYVQLIAELVEQWQGLGGVPWNFWITEQMAMSCAIHEEARWHPLDNRLNVHNHPLFAEDSPQAVEDPKAIHYCWDVDGFNKRDELSDLEQFASGVGGGPLIERVRRIASEVVNGDKCAAMDPACC